MDKIDARIQRYRLLAGYLLQHNRIGYPGKLPNFFWIQVIERVRCNQQRQTVDLQILCGQAPGRQKRRRDNRRCGNAVLFQVG